MPAENMQTAGKNKIVVHKKDTLEVFELKPADCNYCFDHNRVAEEEVEEWVPDSKICSVSLSKDRQELESSDYLDLKAERFGYLGRHPSNPFHDMKHHVEHSHRCIVQKSLRDPFQDNFSVLKEYTTVRYFPEALELERN